MADAQSELRKWQPTEEALVLVPETIARTYGILPLSFKDDLLTVIASQEAKPGLSDIEHFLGLKKPIQIVLGTQDAIQDAINTHYDDGEITSFGFEDDDLDPPPHSL